MIAKVVRGYRPGGLLAYLFGLGRHEEYRDPRVVASWDGAPWLHQPEPMPPPGAVVAGEFDLDLRQLIATMEAEPRRLGLPVRTPPALPPDWRQLLVDGRQLPATAPGWARMWRYDAKVGEVVLRPGYVWHCPVRLAPEDRTLSDAEWEQIAGRLMRAVGIQQAGCRWVAVRHADDHIHLMATLVSETTGTRFHPYRDFLALREECRAIERELGLTPTAPADRTARPAPTRGEREKAQRWGRDEPNRELMHRVVAHAAATTETSESFLAVLRERHLDPVVRRDERGQIVGYTVGVPFDRRRDGKAIRYGGRALAPDLSWPKLCARWTASTETVPGQRPVAPIDTVLPEGGLAALLARRHTAFDQAAAIAHDAAGAIRAAAIDGAGDTDQVGSIAHAAGELLTALVAKREFPMVGGPLTATAIRYDRAARTPLRVLASSRPWTSRSRETCAAQRDSSRPRGPTAGPATPRWRSLRSSLPSSMSSPRSPRGSAYATARTKRGQPPTPPPHSNAWRPLTRHQGQARRPLAQRPRPRSRNGPPPRGRPPPTLRPRRHTGVPRPTQHRIIGREFADHHHVSAAAIDTDARSVRGAGPNTKASSAIPASDIADGRQVRELTGVT